MAIAEDDERLEVAGLRVFRGVRAMTAEFEPTPATPTPYLLT